MHADEARAQQRSREGVSGGCQKKGLRGGGKKVGRKTKKRGEDVVVEGATKGGIGGATTR